MITQELIAALDDLIQSGAKASAALRSLLERGGSSDPRVRPSLEAVDAADHVITNVRTAARDEQSMPILLNSARDAVTRLQKVAVDVGNSDLANSLALKVQTFSAHMKASGLGGTSWLTVIGLGAGLVAAYYVWQNYSKTKKIDSFVYPDDDDDVRPMLQGMSKSLGKFSKFGGSTCGPKLGRSGGARRLGGLSKKYEFEPESRLEGHRGGLSKYEFEPESRLEGHHRGPRRRRTK